MKLKTILVLAAFLPSVIALKAQDTFSIVAVDSATGEVGSAGASCLGYTMPTIPHGAQIISDVIPGKGAIHTQALWESANQFYAHNLMMAGVPPVQIVDSLKINDTGFDSTIRQYGIVDFNGGHPLTAGFTGSNCSDYKNHIVGRYYAIQGNILLGKKVLDSMQSGFLHTKGSLADRLMGALNATKMVGADTRCFAHNSSSLSSFLRVAKPSDKPDNLYIDLYMSYDNAVSGNVKVDPIDSLQHMYSRRKASIEHDPAFAKNIRLLYENGTPVINFSAFGTYTDMEVEVFDLQGRLLVRTIVSQETCPVFGSYQSPSGIYLYSVLWHGQPVATGKVFR